MDWEWSEWTVGSRTDPPRTFTGRDGSDNDDTRVEARRDTNGPGLDSDAGQLREVGSLLTRRSAWTLFVGSRPVNQLIVLSTVIRSEPVGWREGAQS
ncbi:hypothetical protein J6590_105741 [Homalodisca vitripennis]|nr:hypothetical protein J6590_105741 [Homalodisca vitripennis]